MDLVVRNLHTRETDLIQADSLKVRPRDFVVYSGRYGLDLGLTLGPPSQENRHEFRHVASVDRIATESDIERFHRLEREAHEAARGCAARVEEHGLDMRVVSGHFVHDKSKLVIFFVSDHRVDFRALVRDLVSRLHVRVELRQIGVRDETRILGGIGICGRRLCCNGISDRLAPVSIRMAKDQNYSLNSMKVSGPCGRLLCCMAYEHGFYKEERRRYPREGATVRVEDERYRVQEINVISGQVRLSSGDGRQVTAPVCAFTAVGTAANRRRPAPGDVQWELNYGNCPGARTGDDTE